MKPNLLSTATAVSIAVLAGPASAQMLGGWSQNNYVQGSVGASFDGSTRIRSPGVLGGRGDAGVDPGIFGSVLVGHGLGGGLAVEGEGLYGHSDIGLRGSRGLLPAEVDRSAETYGGLVNLKYELPRRFRVGGFGVSPYAAAGVGYGGATYDVAGATGSDDGLIWQAKAGLALHVKDRLTWDVGYRYLQGPRFDGARDGSALGALDLKTDQHIVALGARWRF